MKISQAYYTSCSMGLTGAPGFQINAASAALQGGALANLERLGGYTPPLSAPTRPTPDEIKTFPVSLIFSRLPDGDGVIAQSKYIGQDYSGRFGNYFTHFLVIPRGELDRLNFAPIALWRSGVWKTVESRTTVLPELDTLEDSYELMLEEVAERVLEPEMLQLFGAMVSAVERALDGGPRVIIANTDALVAAWIALATQVLPAHLAWTVSFTTYVKNPAFANAMIAGTTLDSDFGFTDFEIQHQYAVFDFIKKRFSPIPISLFAQCAIKAFEQFGAYGPFQFPYFVKRVAPDLPVQDLAVAFAAFCLTRQFRCGVDAVPICQWCAKSVGTMQCEEVVEVMTALEAECEGSSSGLEAMEALVRAGVHNGMSAQVVPVFAGMLRRVLTSAEVPWLQRVPSLLRESGAQRWVHRFDVSLAELTELTDPSRLCAVLAILEEMGAAGPRPEALKLVGKTMLAPRLEDPAIRQALFALLDSRTGHKVMEGVAASLDERIRDRGTHAHGLYASIEELLKNQTCFSLLEETAARGPFPDLAVWLAAYRMRQDRRPAEYVFEQLLKLYEKLNGKLDSSSFDFAFALAWPVAALEERTRAMLLATYATGPYRAVFGRSVVPALIADCIAARADSPRKADFMQAQMLVAEFPKVLGDSGSTLRAMILLDHMHDLTPFEEVKLLLSLVPNLKGFLRQKTLRRATLTLFDIKDASKHEEQLRHALERYSDSVAETYADELMRRGPQESTRRYFIYARIWFNILDQGEPRGSGCITTAILDLYKTFDKEKRAEIDESMQAEGRYAERWIDLTRSKSIRSRLTGWLRGGR